MKAAGPSNRQLSNCQFIQILRICNECLRGAFDRREVRAMSLFGRKSRPARRRTNQPRMDDGRRRLRRTPVHRHRHLGGGARLRVEDPHFVTPQFQLKFDRTSRGRPCKVAWKKGDVIGVKFV
jgi:hypothetical protein